MPRAKTKPIHPSFRDAMPDYKLGRELLDPILVALPPP
jgi:hypothetical protein